MHVSIDLVAGASRKLRIVSGLYGALMIFVGCAALAMPLFSTLTAVLIVGISLIAGGVVGLIGAFQDRHSRNAWLTGLWAVLAIVLGGSLIWAPGLGAISLTLALGAILIMRGGGSLGLAFSPALRHARLWLIVGGLVGIALGLVVLFNITEMAGVALGTILGVDFVFYGLTLLVAALAGPKALA